MSAARYPLFFVLLVSCASTVTGTTGTNDAALDSRLSDTVLPDAAGQDDLQPTLIDSTGGIDPRCPQRPCLIAPMLRATSAATWTLYPDGRMFSWGSWGPPISSGDNPDANRHDTATLGPRLSSDTFDFSVSAQHGCAIAAYPRRVVCWGDNTYGQLGRGTISPQEGPSEVVGLTDAEGIATPSHDSWAITARGVVLWGQSLLPGARSDSPRLQPRTFTSSRALRFPTGRPYFDFGYLTSTGEVYAFGRNAQGASGSPGDAAVSTPTRIAGIPNAVDYSTGERASCAVSADGAVYCWGDRSGILVPTFNVESSTAVPERVIGIEDAVRVHVGQGHACVLTRTRTVRCWGWVDWEPRDPSTSPAYLPLGPAMELPPVRELAVGGSHACALTLAGEIYCWGHNGYGQLGIPRFYANSNRPRRVPLPQ